MALLKELHQVSRYYREDRNTDIPNKYIINNLKFFIVLNKGPQHSVFGAFSKKMDLS